MRIYGHYQLIHQNKITDHRRVIQNFIFDELDGRGEVDSPPTEKGLRGKQKRAG